MGFSLPYQKKKKPAASLKGAEGSSGRLASGQSPHKEYLSSLQGGVTRRSPTSTATATSIAATTPSPPSSAYSIPSSPPGRPRRRTFSEEDNSITSSSPSRRPPLSPALRTRSSQSSTTSSTTTPPPPTSSGRGSHLHRKPKRTSARGKNQIRVVSPSPQRLETIDAAASATNIQRRNVVSLQSSSRRRSNNAGGKGVNTISSILNSRSKNRKAQQVRDLAPRRASRMDHNDDDDAGDDDGTHTTNHTYNSTVASSCVVNDEPSLDTAQAGNLTNDDTSSALTSLVCLSLIGGSRIHNKNNNDKSSLAGTTSSSGGAAGSSAAGTSAQSKSPESITQTSIARHMRFHLARRLERSHRDSDSDSEDDDDEYENSFFSSSSYGSSDDDDDDVDWSSSSSESDIDVKDENDHLNPDSVHYRAQECLYRGETSQAIAIYRELLSKQRKNVHAQRADTLSRLSVLCLLTGGRRYNEKAARYSREALSLHEDNVKPLQAAVSAMELGLVHFAGNRLDMALLMWRQAMQMACVSMGYDHPHVAILLNNIGVLHFKSGEYTGAIRALEEAVELQRATLRYSCSPINAENAIHQLAITKGNLAVVCDEGYQQMDRARAFLQESLSLYESVDTFARDKMGDTLTDYMDRLGSATRKDECYAGVHAAKDKPDIVARSTSLFGNSDGIPKHMSGEVVDNHDFLLLGTLEPEQTPEERVRRTAVEWFGRQLEGNTGDTAFVSYEKGNKEEARFKESIPVDLDCDTVVNAELHLREINRQAMEHVDHNEIDDALDLFRGALRSHREKYGEIHHLVGSTLHNMGMVYFFAKEYEKAEKSFVEALNVRSAALGAS